MRKTHALALSLVFLLALAAPAGAQVGFGAKTAVGDGEVFVGEPGNLIEPGTTYVYRPGSGGWDEVAQLRASDAGDADGFGRAIAADGDTLLIGADAAGAVYVFARQGGWTEVARLTADAGESGKFGGAVAISADTAVVGAPGANGGRGAVYVFARTGGSWSLTATLEGDGTESVPAREEDEAPSEWPEAFGATVAIDGDRILVGASGGTLDMFLGGMFSRGTPSGAVYAFTRADDGWERTQKLQPPLGADAATFGFSLTVRDGTAIIGAPSSDNLSGAAHAYRYDEETAEWTWRGRLVPFDARPGTMFGASVAMTDDQVFVGSPGAGSGRLQGRVYRFARGSGGEWMAAIKMASTGLKWGSIHGTSVAARHDTVVAGTPGDDYGAGSALIMSRVADGWATARVASEARGMDAVGGLGLECVNGHAGMFECDNIDLVAFVPVHEMGGGRGVTTNDMWGWVDPETDREYAVVGLRDGTAFVDVTDPSNPVFVAKLPKSDASPASLWRDVKIHQNHAFVVADASGRHGVQIVDLTKLREFDGTAMTLTEDAHYGEVYSTHNIVINEDTSFAYAVGNSSGGNTCGGALHMINIEDPRNPIFAGCYQPMVQAARGQGGTHDAQCVTYRGPDERYSGREICFSSDGRALNIGDVTDKRDPKLLANATYPNLAYTHQGWVDEDHEYFYMNDEGDEAAGLVTGTRTLIWDVRDLEDPILVGEHTTDNPATDHNLYILGDYMFQSNYRSGLHVFDITDRENIRKVGYFDTVPWGGNEGMGDIVSGAIGSWSNYPYFKSGVIGVASGKEGLFLVRLKAARPNDD